MEGVFLTAAPQPAYIQQKDLRGSTIRRSAELVGSVEWGEASSDQVGDSPADTSIEVSNLPEVANPIATAETQFVERRSSSNATISDCVQVSLSIVVPVFNEARTIKQVLDDLLGLSVSFEIEVIVVDDGSHDGTAAIIATCSDTRLIFIRHAENMGKGMALLTGIRHASGTHLIPFDADCEYDARDIPRLVQPVIDGRADVVYGARIAGVNTRYRSFWYPLGSRVTTLAANLLFSARLKDLHTCLKLVPLSTLRGMNLRQGGFGLDTELTARLLKMRQHPYEIPVSYLGRSREEGKKIGWRDGVKCLAILLQVKIDTTEAFRVSHSADPERSVGP